MSQRVTIEKQIRDMRIILDVLHRGNKLKQSEFYLLQPGLLEAIRTLEFCRDNKETIRGALAGRITRE